MITRVMKALGITLGLSLGFVVVSGLPALGEKAILKTVSIRVVRPAKPSIKVSEPVFHEGVLRVISEPRMFRPARPQRFQKLPSAPITVIENPEPALGGFVNVPFVDAGDRFDSHSLPIVREWDHMGRPINSTKNWKQVGEAYIGTLSYLDNSGIFYLDGNSFGNRVNDFIALSMSFPSGGHGLKIKKLEREVSNPQNFILYYSISTPGRGCLVTMDAPTLTDIIAIQRPSGLIGLPSIEPRLLKTILGSPCIN